MTQLRSSSRVMLVVAGVAATASAACSLAVGFDGFVGAGDAGLNGLTDAHADGPAGNQGDGATNPQDSSTNADANQPPVTDAGDAGETSTPLDAGDPNLPPVFTSGGTTCKTFTAGPDGGDLCDDFDKSALTTNWIVEGPYEKLTSYNAKSMPNDFLVNAPPNTGAGTFVSKITHNFTRQSTNMLVSFDYFPETISVGTSAMIMAAVEYTKNSAAKYSMRLVYVSGQVRLEESTIGSPPATDITSHTLFTIPSGQWTHVSLDIVAEGATPGMQINLDGTPAAGRETLTPTPDLDATPTLILGAVYAQNPHSGWTMRYDNVTVVHR